MARSGERDRTCDGSGESKVASPGRHRRARPRIASGFAAHSPRSAAFVARIAGTKRGLLPGLVEKARRDLARRRRSRELGLSYFAAGAPPVTNPCSFFEL